EDDRLIFYITADRFLRNMVRAVVGTLLEIGEKKQPVEYIREVIESENRSKAGSSVPAHGLYLTNIQYPNLQE
ncbi:MAG: tRNA pseudouridine(38-40) synthase TruA, partial [Salegentibacter sp.]